MGSVTASKPSRPARKDRALVSPGLLPEDLSALSPAERAKLYREFSQDARQRGERSIEPYRSYCLKIANEFECLAAAIEAELIVARAQPR